MDLPKEAFHFLHANRIVITPVVDFLTLQYLVAEADVNIAPLTRNIFTECKSELKYFEAAIVETVTCATPTNVFKDCIVQGENGFLCAQGEWFDTIEALYLGKIDRERMVKNAHEHALARYSGDAVVRQIENAYDSFAGNPDPLQL